MVAVLCDICGKSVRSPHTCPLCGRRVCNEDFNTDVGACKRCVPERIKAEKEKRPSLPKKKDWKHPDLRPPLK